MYISQVCLYSCAQTSTGYVLCTIPRKMYDYSQGPNNPTLSPNQGQRLISYCMLFASKFEENI